MNTRVSPPVLSRAGAIGAAALAFVAVWIAGASAATARFSNGSDVAQPPAQSKPAAPGTHLFVITSADNPKAAPVGTWQADYPSEPRSFTATLTSDRGKVSGAITMGQQSFNVFDGKLDAKTITFSVKSPTGNRTITFTGTADKDRLVFTRDVKIGPGGLPGGDGIFGAGGQPKFTATRAK